MLIMLLEFAVKEKVETMDRLVFHVKRYFCYFKNRLSLCTAIYIRLDSV